jgi:AraC-like DNA-binding protein
MSSPCRRRHDAGGVLMQARNSYPMHTNDQAVDRLKINVRDAWELRWWCRQLGCTEAQLKVAIDAMGAIAGNVRKYLAREQAQGVSNIERCS